MKEKIDPFILVIAFACSLFVFVVVSENQNRVRKAELAKEAIQKNWTPEQIKVLLDAR